MKRQFFCFIGKTDAFYIQFSVITMSIFELFLIGLGLSMDCFAVIVGFGTAKKISSRDLVKIASFFGLFQGIMTLIGWLFGTSLKPVIESFDHWIAFSILAVIGIKMIMESFEKEREKSIDLVKIKILITVSIATSIDALITGVSLGFIRVNMILAVAMITIVAFLVTLAGGKISEKTTFIPAKKAEIAGGLVLIAIGLKILLEHTGLMR
ncbi:MAG: manganese efflux pump MntP family protein [Bacteroidota bacterium]